MTMKSNQYMTVSDIREMLKQKFNNEEYVLDKSGVKTVEIINASFIADENYIFKKPNYEYIERELAWYYSMSLNVYDIPEPVPVIWKQVASKEGLINSNYGWCIYNEDNFHQYANVLKELKKNPNSRRCLMIYTRPSMQYEYNKLGMSDFMCTNTVQYLIRDNALHSIVQMRSNDAVFGYNNDVAWQQHVLECLSKDLNIKIGNIYWNVGSMHVYERHFGFINA